MTCGYAQSSDGTAQTISGRVLNATTGQPVFRALVSASGSATLTDTEGHFQLSVDGSAVTLSVQKPGYYPGADPEDSGGTTLRAPFPDAPVDLRLYPEALLTGTVTSQTGEPVPEVFVAAYRSVFDEQGRRWVRGGMSRTDSHGGFRIPVPAGDYVLQIFYRPSFRFRGAAVRSNDVVLPQIFPADSLTNTSDRIHLGGGSQQNVDLQAQVLPLARVLVHTDGSSSQGLRMRLEARTPSGAAIPANLTSAETPGELQTMLPVGSYTLEARRIGPEGQQQEAVASITVDANGQSGVNLQFSPVNSIPVEIQVDSSTTMSDNTAAPNLYQLGLSLEDVTPALEMRDGTVRPVSSGGQNASFAPPPGTYRLRSRGGGTWFVESATYGNTDLLSQNLVVASGIGSVPIRLVVSNQTASLSGTVTSNGQPAACWIYLLPSSPSATALYLIHTNSDGSFSRSDLPPGSYRAIAFDRRYPVGFDDPHVVASFASQLQNVTLRAGDKATLELKTTTPLEAQ